MGREKEKQEKEIVGNSAAARRCGREGGKKKLCKMGMGVEGGVERNIEWAFRVLGHQCLEIQDKVFRILGQAV